MEAWAWQQGRGKEGRGRAAQLQRHMLLADVERILIECSIMLDKQGVWDSNELYCPSILVNAFQCNGLSFSSMWFMAKDCLWFVLRSTPVKESHMAIKSKLCIGQMHVYL